LLPSGAGQREIRERRKRQAHRLVRCARTDHRGRPQGARVFAVRANARHHPRGDRTPGVAAFPPHGRHRRSRPARPGFSAKSGGSRVSHFAARGRLWAQPHRRELRCALRPVVESRRRKSGHRSDPPHRPDQSRHRLPAAGQGEHRGKDPEAAARIHPNNIRYVIRALEINIAGNEPKVDKKAEPLYEVFSIGIEWSRETLYERINGRVDELVHRGLVNEVKTLLMQGFDEKIPAMSSIGYQEIIQYIRGNCTLEEAVEEIKKNTRNYAKRQLTWFRHYKDVHWLNGEELEAHLSAQKQPSSQTINS